MRYFWIQNLFNKIEKIHINLHKIFLPLSILQHNKKKTKMRMTSILMIVMILYTILMMNIKLKIFKRNILLKILISVDKQLKIKIYKFNLIKWINRKTKFYHWIFQLNIKILISIKRFYKLQFKNKLKKMKWAVFLLKIAN